MCSTCADTVFGEIDRAAAISRLVLPCPIRPAISISRAVSRGAPESDENGRDSAGPANEDEPEDDAEPENEDDAEPKNGGEAEPGSGSESKPDDRDETEPGTGDEAGTEAERGSKPEPEPADREEITPDGRAEEEDPARPPPTRAPAGSKTTAPAAPANPAASPTNRAASAGRRDRCAHRA